MNRTRRTASLDETFDALADRRRREVLRHLRESPDESATLRELTAHLASAEVEGEAAPADGHDRVATTLAHVHLPKLDGHGVVAYDADGGTVRYRGDRALEHLLDALDGE